jgi:hypothetical protein
MRQTLNGVCLFSSRDRERVSKYAREREWESAGTKDQKHYKRHDDDADNDIDHHGTSKAGSFLRLLDRLIHH